MATLLSLTFRSIGQASFAFVVSVSAVLVLAPQMAGLDGVDGWEQILLAGRPLWLDALLAYVTAEGLFYGACLVMAASMSAHRPSSSSPLSSERRQELWTRILRDPTQPAPAFVADWFYFDASHPSGVHRGGARSASLRSPQPSPQPRSRPRPRP